MNNGDRPEHIILCRLLRHIIVMMLNENTLRIKVKVNITDDVGEKR